MFLSLPQCLQRFLGVERIVAGYAGAMVKVVKEWEEMW